MLQSLLVDRFHLRCHWIQQVHTVYSLVVEKSGPKLVVAKPDENGGFRAGPGYFEGHAYPMDQLADDLGGNLDHIVQDRTGLTGKYDFTLHFSNPDANGGSNNADDLSNPEAQARLFTALQEHLGLKLVAEKRPVRMLVIDSFERPTPN